MIIIILTLLSFPSFPRHPFLAVLTSLSFPSFPRCPYLDVLPFLSSPSFPRCPYLAVLAFFSSLSLPFLPFFSWHTGHNVLAVSKFADEQEEISTYPSEQWILNCVYSSQYLLQIRKCRDRSCCSAERSIVSSILGGHNCQDQQE